LTTALIGLFPSVGRAQGFSYTPTSGLTWEGLMNPHLWEYQLLTADARATGQAKSAVQRRKAEALLKRALRLEPRRPEALKALGDLYLKWGEWKKAVKIFRKLKRHYREKMPRSLVFFIAVAHSRAGDYGKAAAMFKSLVRQGDKRLLKAKLWNNAAQATMAGGRLTRALVWFDRAISASPGYRLALYGRAVALLRDGQVEPAANQLKGLTRLEPNLKNLYVTKYFFLPPADRLFYVAAMLEIRACRAQADTVWKRYFARSPGSPWAEAVKRFRAKVPSMVGSRASAGWCRKHEGVGLPKPKGVGSARGGIKRGTIGGTRGGTRGGSR
jgi:tetratricopeptide (TPR) repeat protein